MCLLDDHTLRHINEVKYESTSTEICKLHIYDMYNTCVYQAKPNLIHINFPLHSSTAKCKHYNHQSNSARILSGVCMHYLVTST